jgi:ribonuclease-3
VNKKLETLQKTIGITFSDKSILKRSLIHRSYLNETSKETESNERLEFLGDAVLELIVSDFLFRNYPNRTEGRLTSFRSSIVNTKTLAFVAKEINLGNYLFLSKGEEAGGGRSNSSLLADTFEALLGAIYLDKGLEAASKLVEKLLLPLLPNIIKTKAYIDYKSKLQSLVQEQMRITPTYRVEKETGPDHDKTFYVKCLAGRQVLGKGSGKSKQEAEQSAAKNALEKFESSQ